MKASWQAILAMIFQQITRQKMTSTGYSEWDGLPPKLWWATTRRLLPIPMEMFGSSVWGSGRGSCRSARSAWWRRSSRNRQRFVFCGTYFFLVLEAQFTDIRYMMYHLEAEWSDRCKPGFYCLRFLLGAYPCGRPLGRAQGTAPTFIFGLLGTYACGRHLGRAQGTAPTCIFGFFGGGHKAQPLQYFPQGD